MPQFRKLPVVIEAVLSLGTQDSNLGIVEWTRGSATQVFMDGRTILKIKTLEGVMTVSPGDWVIKGVNGEFYPCKPDVFAATYEPAPHSKPKFKRGDLVRKVKGSQWCGRVVGEYSTDLTPEGYAVESAAEKGSVQIYPAAALALAGTTCMPFGQAMEAIKAGKRIARDGWNGKGMFVYLVPPASYPVQTGAAMAHFGEGSMVPYNAYMAIKNVDGTVSTWVPSVNDCLADDWREVV